MECKDRNCPIHGTLSTRGTVLEGVVASDKMQGTVIVERDRMVKVKKYDRYKRSKSRIPAHNPPCINAHQGEAVRIMECRKLSKTVCFTITEKLVKAEKAQDEKPKGPEHKATSKKAPSKKAGKKEVKHG